MFLMFSCPSKIFCTQTLGDLSRRKMRRKTAHTHTHTQTLSLSHTHTHTHTNTHLDSIHREHVHRHRLSCEYECQVRESMSIRYPMGARATARNKTQQKSAEETRSHLTKTVREGRKRDRCPAGHKRRRWHPRPTPPHHQN